MPDLSYFLPFGIARYETHSISALFSFCLPVGMIFYSLYHTLLSPVLFSIAPNIIKQRLNPHISIGYIPSHSFPAIMLSLFIGASTHLIWDLFTHPPHNFFPAALAAWEEIILFKFDGYTVYAYRFLQHSSTMLGFGLISYWLIKWYKKTLPNQKPVWQPPMPFQTFARITFIPLPALIGLIAGFLSWQATSVSPFLYRIVMAVRDVIIYGGRYLLLTWLLLGISLFLLRYVQHK